jgi:hypothetical protein
MARPGSMVLINQTLPEDFAEALRALANDRPRRDAALLAAHEEGWTKQALADAIGTSREWVRRCIASAEPRSDVPEVPPAPRRPEAKPRELKPCGTRSAYMRHVRRGEPVDEACHAAALAYAAEVQRRTGIGRARSRAFCALARRYPEAWESLRTEEKEKEPDKDRTGRARAMQRAYARLAKRYPEAWATLLAVEKEKEGRS